MNAESFIVKKEMKKNKTKVSPPKKMCFFYFLLIDI